MAALDALVCAPPVPAGPPPWFIPNSCPAAFPPPLTIAPINAPKGPPNSAPPPAPRAVEPAKEPQLNFLLPLLA